MSTAADIVTSIITALQLSDPAWDINPGTAEYKIIDAASNQISIANNNSTLQQYSLDVNSMSGNQLDQFVSNFGIQRLQGTRATGTVTVGIGSPATTIIYIPMGTQFYVSTSSANGVIVYFQTTSQATIVVGSASVEIPVEATIAGTVGNVLANQITGISSNLVGINSVTNVFATSGGSDAETDAQLRARFLATAFRNESGTVDQYVGTISDNTSVGAVNVIGSDQFYTETLSIGQYITVSSLASTFELEFNSGNTVSGIVYSSSTTTMAANLQTALNTLAASYAATEGQPLTIGVTYSAALTAATAIDGPTYIISYNFPIPTIDLITTPTMHVTVSGPLVISAIPDIKSTLGITSFIYGLYSANGVSGIGIPGSDYEQVASYTSNYTKPPVIVDILTTSPNFVAMGPLTLGNLVGLQQQYIPYSSRNWLYNLTTMGLFYVDIFVQGSNPTPVIAETSIISGNTFSALPNTYQTLEGVAPDTSDYFIPLQPQPILSAQSVYCASDSLQYGFAYNPTWQIDWTTDAPTAGTFTLTVDITASISHTSAPIPWNATAAQIQQALMNLNFGLVSVTGGPLGTADLYFQFAYYQPNTGSFSSGYPTLSANYTSLTYPDSTVAASQVTTQFYTVFENDFTTDGGPYGQQGSALAASGIGVPAAEVSDLGGAPLNFIVYYTYDQLINNLNNVVQQITLATQNALVHSAVPVQLLINLVVSYVPGSTPTQINAAVTTAINNYLSTITFSGQLIMADIINAALSATGVLNARIASSSDNSTFYGIQQVLGDGLTVVATSSTNQEDFYLDSNQLPTLFAVNTYLRAAGGGFNV